MSYNTQTKVILSISRNPGNFGTIFHNYLYSELNLNFFYKACPCDDLVLGIRSIKNFNLYGMSISMPFKQKVLKLVDEIDPSATQANAINTIINFNNTLIGFNTDFYAFDKVVSKLKDIKTVLIIGSGAIAEMCIRYYSMNKLVNIEILARNTMKVKSLVEKYKVSTKSTQSKYDLVINATPQDFNHLCKSNELQESSTIIDYPIMNRDHKIQNLNSNTKYISGIQLTREQAHKQFELYTNVKVDLKLLESAFKYTYKQIK